MRIRSLLPLLACAAVLAFAAEARAQRRPLCVSGPACVLRAYPAVLPSVLAGNGESAALLAGVTGLPRWALPLVALARDPVDGPASGPLSARLSPAQEALLGCGPLFGTNCDRAGIDLLNADAGVLMQAWPGFAGALGQPGSVRFEDGTVIQIPGSRGPAGQLPPALICTNPTAPGCGTSARLVHPYSGRPFPSEMAALSWNFLAMLAAMSTGGEAEPGRFDPANPYAHYDPNDPRSHAAQGQCSFAQPQYCSMVQALFDVDVRSAGNGSFGRRDFVWHSQHDPVRRVEIGCLPARTGLASLRLSLVSGGGGKGRAARCPLR